MEILLLIATIITSAFLFTMVACAWRIAQKRKPSFSLAIVGALCTSLTLVFIIYGRDLFTHGFWENDKAPMAVMVPLFFCLCTLVSLMPAFFVVLYHCAKFTGRRNADKP
jgi:hypothetical protein